MAEQEQNIIQINGTLAGFTFYKLNGKNVVRKTSGPSKDTINNNPAYKKTKNNNSEFAGATFLSKNIRQGLGTVGKLFQDTYMASRLTGICRTIIANGKGEHGKRTGNLLENPKLLVGFPLIKNKPINRLCNAKHTLKTNNNREQITINFPTITTTNFLQIPKNASHFKITLSTAITAPFCYHNKTKKYQAETTANNGFGNTITSKPYSLNQNHTNCQLSLNTAKNKLHKKEAISVWLGIAIYQNSTNEETLLNSTLAMQCIAVI